MKKSSQGLLLASAFLALSFIANKPSYATSQSISVTGNGSNSVNTTQASQSQSTFVTQTNNATVTNVVTVNADTGHNSADSNTSQNSSISTGSISSTVLVNNQIGANSTASCCTTTSDPLTVTVSGNGSSSNNSVHTTVNHQNVVTQVNNTNVLNKVGGALNTGENSLSSNTDGSANLSTGSINSKVQLNNLLNTNSATLPCCAVAKNPEIQAPQNPVGGNPIPSLPVAALLPTTSQVLAASTKLARAQVLPMTGAGENLWIMSLASLVLAFGFFIRRSAALLLLPRLSA